MHHWKQIAWNCFRLILNMQHTKTSPYATAAESAGVMVPDTRTPAEKLVDQMLESGGSSEQGAEYGVVLRHVAVQLAEQRDELLARIEVGKEVWRHDQARIAELMSRCDELLEALKLAERHCPVGSDAEIIARAAIAKVEGGAA